MTPTTLFPLLLAIQSAPVQDAVRLDLWPHTLRYGEEASVAVRVERDGYLTVLRLDTDGRRQVLFPLATSEDGFVRRGERVLVKDRYGNAGFVAYEGAGEGTVLAALSGEPYDFTAVSAGGFGSRVRLNETDLDPVGALLGLVEEMTGGSEFVYDVAHYGVREDALLGYGARHAGWPDCYGSGPGYRFGRFYYRFSDYRFSHRWWLRSAYYDPFSPFWFGSDAYDPACLDRHRFGYGYGYWSDWGRVVIRRPTPPDSGAEPDTGRAVDPIKPRRRDPPAATIGERAVNLPATREDARDRIGREPRATGREERPERERPAAEPRRPDAPSERRPRVERPRDERPRDTGARPAAEPRRPDPPVEKRPQIERPRDTGARPTPPPSRPPENRPPPKPAEPEKKPQT